MSNLTGRTARLETRHQLKGKGRPVCVFGDDDADLERKVAEARLQFPLRPVMAFRWCHHEQR